MATTSNDQAPRTTSRMRAMLFTRYGPPDVLHLGEVERPTPGPDEVLVRVRAASANPADWHLMRGEPFLARLQAGLRKPKRAILGADVAGTVEAVGTEVTRFQPSDEVFGELFSSLRFGGFAEYAAVPRRALVHKPANVTFEEAAAVPLAAITALQALRDAGHLEEGQRVLINGASGGVGTYAVQLARHFGAEVTGVTSTRNLELVRSIGADHVVDYTEHDFTREGRRYDLIVDAVGNRSVRDYKRALEPQGRGVIVGFTTLRRLFTHIVFGGLASATSGRSIGMMNTVSPNDEDIALMASLLESGALVSVVDRTYDFAELAAAIAYLEEGHARGKVVVTI